MVFTPNKTPVEVIKEGVFGGTYFWKFFTKTVAWKLVPGPFVFAKNEA